jgi:hypothetical protein
MADSQTLERELASFEGSDDTRTFSLSCGCYSVTCNGRLVEVQWCPRHSTMHGTMSATHERRQSEVDGP